MLLSWAGLLHMRVQTFPNVLPQAAGRAWSPTAWLLPLFVFTSPTVCVTQMVPRQSPTPGLVEWLYFPLLFLRKSCETGWIKFYKILHHFFFTSIFVNNNFIWCEFTNRSMIPSVTWRVTMFITWMQVIPTAQLLVPNTACFGSMLRELRYLLYLQSYVPPSLYIPCHEAMGNDVNYYFSRSYFIKIAAWVISFIIFIFWICTIWLHRHHSFWFSTGQVPPLTTWTFWPPWSTRASRRVSRLVRFVF